MGRLNKFKTKLKKWLFRILFTPKLKELQLQQKNRIDEVESFFHNFLSEKSLGWENRLIIKNGIYNYFLLPDGSLPRIHFSLPEIPLFVYIGDYKTASWPEAREFGVSREEWELAQQNLACYESELAKLVTEDVGQVLVLNWNDSTNPYSLMRQLKIEVE